MDFLEAMKHVDGREIEFLDMLSIPPVVETFEMYDSASKVKGFLCSLYCRTFNSDHPEFDRVSKLEDRWADAMFQFAKKQDVQGHKRTVVRYLCWRSYYPNGIDTRRLCDDAVLWGLVYRNGDAHVVRGLHFKVGDNVFSVDSRGRQHRTYVGHCGLQVFYIQNPIAKEILKGMNLPEMPKRYDVIGLYDGKGAARPIGLKWQEKQLIREMYG